MLNNAGTEEDMVEFQDGITRALREIFGTMMNQPVRMVPEKTIQDQTRLSAIIGFGGRISGFIGLHVSKATACWIATGLLGMDIAEVDETVRDAIGELGNMVAGGLKKHISRSEEMFKVSIPSVIEGSSYSSYAPAGARQLMMGAMAGSHRFRIQLVLEER